MNISRRQALLSSLSAGGLLGLRALATGIPAAILANPTEALADDACTGTRAPQYLILSSSGSGDPFNANAPGTYDDAGILHSADPLMAKTALTLGATKTTAAKPWASLPQAVLNRTSFIHHRSMTNNHGNHQKVLGLMGAVRRSESLVSLISRSLAPCLGTIQDAPIALGAEPMTFKGRLVPPLPPTVLRDVLTASKSGPALLTDTTLPKLRDDTLNQINDIYKSSGNVLQKRMLDNLAISRTQVRSLSDSLLGALSSITNDGSDGQMIAAAALIKMNIAPVVTVHLGFGGDNHTDNSFARETSETIASITALNTLMTKLTEFGLTDKVTFGLLNVFGRTLKEQGTTGRTHAQALSTAILIGKNVKGSLCGGVEPDGHNDYQSLAIDSKTGKGSATGDIAIIDSLGAVGKTIGAAVGVPVSVLDDSITQGKVITGAVTG